MHSERYRVSVEVLENGFAVETPDFEAMAKKKAEAKKSAGKDKSPMVEMYLGDCTKKYAAKNVKEVLAFVEQSLKSIPEQEFDDEFNKAAKEMK